MTDKLAGVLEEVRADRCVWCGECFCGDYHEKVKLLADVAEAAGRALEWEQRAVFEDENAWPMREYAKAKNALCTALAKLKEE